MNISHSSASNFGATARVHGSLSDIEATFSTAYLSFFKNPRRIDARSCFVKFYLFLFFILFYVFVDN